MEKAVIGPLAELIHCRGQAIVAELQGQVMVGLASSSEVAVTVGECEVSKDGDVVPIPMTVEASVTIEEASEEVKEGDVKEVCIVATVPEPEVKTTTPTQKLLPIIEVEDLLVASPIQSIYTAYAVLELLYGRKSPIIDSLKVFAIVERLDTGASLIIFP